MKAIKTSSLYANGDTFKRIDVIEFKNVVLDFLSTIRSLLR